MKHAGDVVEILEAFDLTGSLREAARLTGCSPMTVARYVRLRERGQVAADPVRRDQILDPYLARYLSISRSLAARSVRTRPAARSRTYRATVWWEQPASSAAARKLPVRSNASRISTTPSALVTPPSSPANSEEEQSNGLGRFSGRRWAGWVATAGQVRVRLRAVSRGRRHYTSPATRPSVVPAECRMPKGGSRIESTVAHASGGAALGTLVVVGARWAARWAIVVILLRSGTASPDDGGAQAAPTFDREVASIARGDTCRISGRVRSSGSYFSLASRA